MKGLSALLATSAALAAAGALAEPARIVARQSGTGSASLPTITVRGNAFFAGNDRFYIRGLDYQPGGSSNAADPIADEAGCRRDVAVFRRLGINTVRVYTVDNTLNHDTCMNLLAEAGIYLALDLNTPKYSLNRANPGPSYNPTYLQSLFATIDAFAGYSNTLLFFSGNEVINDNTTSNTAPYIKAVTRDIKQYIGSMGYRAIPVGYSAADVAENRYETAQYMNCGTDDQRSDFFAFNDYSWCDPSSYQQSGWDQKVATYNNYSIPLFLSEFGCIQNTRTFGEIASLYGPLMTPVYSGGLVYEYSQEPSGYGLVTINGNSVSELPDFAALRTALANTPAPSGDGGYRSSGSPSTCPAQSDTWQVSSDSLPAIPEGAKVYMTRGAGTGPGLAGLGSQDAGGESTETASAGSGQVTATRSGSTATGTAASAAGSLKVPLFELGPFVCCVVLLVSTAFGAALL